MKKNRLLTSGMAAEILGFSASYVRRLLNSGKLLGTKYGPDWLISTVEVKRFKLKLAKTKESKCKSSSQASESLKTN